MSAQVIEDEAISVIDQSFQALRSSTAAFNMLLKFKHVHSREAINSHLMRKFNDVLVQYCKEVAYVHLPPSQFLYMILTKTQTEPCYVFAFKRTGVPFLCRWNTLMTPLRVGRANLHKISSSLQ